MKEAMYYVRLDDDKVRCELCPHLCVIAPGKRGICRTRVNEGGSLYSEIYNRVMARGMDPIEKKPFYHFHPGSTIYSLGTRGCNQSCDFCQNWQMLEPDAPTGEITSRQAVEEARELGSIGIAYTYNEPLIWYEFVLECSRLAKDEGLVNVLVTNGFISPAPFEELAPFIDAMNVDVKSMEPDFYRRICGSELEPVLDTCRAARRHGIHLEVTNLIIPTLNDSDELIAELVDFVSGELGREVPVHFSAYFPAHKMTIALTPLSTLLRAGEIAKEKLYYVYLGNVAGREGKDTHCPQCGNLLVSRTGGGGIIEGVADGKCSNCGRKADMVL
ncbi:MAG: AmmeMemoRadiSam system radical SAM enzyme [Actinobacteria bacterium]|nr:AmmeMemoRadiSam system radical SAM enzyme [Actinomycetota bacterium]